MGRHLTDEERTRIRVLYHDGGLTITKICETTGHSRSQVNRAIKTTHGPRQRKGPSPVIGPEEEEKLSAFVTESRRNRFLSWRKVADQFMDGVYGYKAVRNALLRMGYQRYVARKKPPISEENRSLRKRWAQDHVGWSFEQWSLVFWTDETWITGGWHTRQFVTRKVGEEYADVMEKNTRE